jgi:hypothetical protein
MRQGALWMSEISAQPTSAESPDDGVVVRARAQARHIVETHQVSPLPDDVNRHLDEIMDRARRELVGD